MKLKPIGDRVLIRRKPEETVTKGGLFIPDQYTEKPMEGEVIAVGDGKILDNGMVVKPQVEVGDEVLFAKFAGMEVSMADGEFYLIMTSNEVLGKIE